MIDRFVQEPYRYDFFQAVRLLERMAASEATDRSPSNPVGQDYDPLYEVVHFRAQASRGFPVAPIKAFRRTPDNGQEDKPAAPPEMIVTFMGMTGPSGVLPQHYSQLVIDRSRAKDYALRDFLNIFDHRMISLFYRAWQKYRLPFLYERYAVKPSQGEDPATLGLTCLVGLGPASLRQRLEIRDETLLYFSGHFAHSPRNAISLKAILEDYCGLPAEVLQFQGQWLYLCPQEDQSRLPRRADPLGLNTQLGRNVIIGERVWSVESKLRIRLGPLAYQDFQQFTPTGRALLKICQLVRTYVGMEFDFDIQPVLVADEVPWCRLTSEGPDQPMLGWNTWVRNNAFHQDVDDAVFINEGWPCTHDVQAAN